VTQFNTLYKGKNAQTYFSQERPELLSLIPNDVSNILDLGCGGGVLGKIIKRRQSVNYCGIELDPKAAENAKLFLDTVYTGNLETMNIPFKRDTFDILIFADVLEHMFNPFQVLKRWLSVLKYDGHVIISLPNVRHFTVTFALLLSGKWEYSDRGILDETHLRFFTKSSCRKLLDNAGLSIEIEKPNMKYKKRYYQLFDYLTFHLFKDHFVLQWMYVAKRKKND